MLAKFPTGWTIVLLMAVWTVLSALPLSAKPVYPETILTPGEAASLSRQLREEFTRLSGELERAETAYDSGEFGPEDPALSDRFELARELAGILKEQIAAGNADSLLHARRGMADFAAFLRFFTEKKALYAAMRTAGEPRAISVRDFGAKGDGVTDDSAAFAAAVAAAAEADGAPVEIRIPAGNYLFRKVHSCNRTVDLFQNRERKWVPETRRAHLLLNGLRNVTLKGEGGGATLLFGDDNENGVVIAGCDNLRLENLTLRNLRAPFLQGEIVEVFPQEKALRVKADPRFLLPDDPLYRSGRPVCQSYDAATGTLIGDASHFFYNRRFEKLPDGSWKLYFLTFKPGLRPGLTLIVPARKNGCNMVLLSRSRLCVFQKITVLNSRSAAFLSEGNFAEEYRECRVLPDRAGGALLSTNADGIHCNSAWFGAFVSGCEFRNLGDDAFNTYNRGWFVEEVLPDGILTRRPVPAGTGFSILSLQDGSIRAEGISRGTAAKKAGAKSLPMMRIDRPLPEGIVSYAGLEKKYSARQLQEMQSGLRKLELPDIIFPHDGRGGVGTVIRDNSFSGCRNNGLALQASSVLVKNNRIDNFNGIGINIGALLQWREGFHPGHIRIQNNRISRTSIGVRAAVQTARGYGGRVNCLRNIMLRNNRIEQCGRSFDLHNGVTEQSGTGEQK